MRQFNNILVHSLVNIGDVLLATSAIALLKKNNPTAKVTFLVKPAAAELMYNNPVVDEVIVFKYKEKKKSWQSMWYYVKELRKRQFDLSISLDRKLRPALLTWLAGIPVRIGPDRLFDNKTGWVTHLFTDVVHTPDDFLNTHQSELFQSIIRGYFGYEGTELPVIGNLTEIHQDKAEKLINVLPMKEKNIALCVKGTYYLKNWPQECFVELVKKLAQRYDAAFYIVGAPEDHEYAEQVVKMCPVPVANFCGKTTLLEYAALMNKSDLLITIDTGGMHIAATTNVPIVGIFRCVSKKRWHPMTQKSTAITTKQSDCLFVKSPEDCPGKYCVKDISVNLVYQCVIELLKEKYGTVR